VLGLADHCKDTFLLVVGENSGLRHRKPHCFLCFGAKDYVSKLGEGQTKVEPQHLRGLGAKPHIMCGM